MNRMEEKAAGEKKAFDLQGLVFRPLERRDYGAVEDMIRKTWKYDGLGGNPKDAAHMARLYLRSCLRRAGFSCVAADGERVLGVILAGSEKDGRRPALSKAFAQLYAVLLLFSTKTGRRIGKFFERFDQADTALLKGSGRQFGGEICLFAVDQSLRGGGIGKQLYARALDYLKAEGAKDFYLFTDTSCTYQFYEKRGMQRLGEKDMDCRPYTDLHLHMFLYGREVEPQAASAKKI